MGNYGTLVYAGGREDNNLTLHELVHPEVVQGDGKDLDGLGLQGSVFAPVIGLVDASIAPVGETMPNVGDQGKVVELTAAGVQARMRVDGRWWPQPYFHPGGGNG